MTLESLDNLIREAEELVALVQERVAQSTKIRAEIERLDKEIDAIVACTSVKRGQA